MLQLQSMRDLVRNLGLYPIPQELQSMRNLLKAWVILFCFVVIFLINAYIRFKLSIFVKFSIISPTFHRSSLMFFNKAFWNAILYLINKKKIKIIISGINLNNMNSTSAVSTTDMKDIKLQDFKNSVVISNHRSLFDFILIYYLKTMMETTTHQEINLSFFNWNEIWSTPNLSLLWAILNNDENWEYNKVQLEKTLRNMVNESDPAKTSNWIVHFPEVNIFDEKTHSAQTHQADKFYLPKLNELLYPRFNNFSNLIAILQKSNSGFYGFKNLIDLTILYYNPLKNMFVQPKLFEILSLKQPILIINIDLKFKPLNKLPFKQRKLEKWLELDWCEKDKVIEVMQKNMRIDE
ncbi:hypothetical protein WICMUC_001850 [Wickerhamomyces mucosus]|uniref:Phospholipid/glycerol acyltransferase domain-containing protein n=1 Tax=Wickerhamomyces mucosus TaxID=1378264 RepID=A0A9P8PSZ6_9ASCO|nr:hypothetical protein WICMUC_001850 [Wickerhamomyces mucosus]